MKTFLVEDRGTEKKTYDSIFIQPRHLGIFTNRLTIKIIEELIKNPCCAIDLAKALSQDKQKIYYYLRKMEKARVIRIVKHERRAGLTANIYGVVSPVIASKLYDNGKVVKKSQPIIDPSVINFLDPFIKEGRLNAKIVIGSPIPHGKYEKAAFDGTYVNDLTMFLGNYLDELNLPCYILDTHLREEDLKKNLIIIGSPAVNTIAEKMNMKMPLNYEIKSGSWKIKSSETKKEYSDDYAGVVIKTRNPFSEDNYVLIVSGIRSRGTIASIIAVTRYTSELLDQREEVARVVKGIDKSGDGIIDHVRFLE
jgi:hypothetical protein